MNELHNDVDLNKFYFEYEGTKDINFNEYYDSKELFNKIKSLNIKFDDSVKKQKELLNKINEVNIGKKNSEQKQVIIDLENF